MAYLSVTRHSILMAIEVGIVAITTGPLFHVFLRMFSVGSYSVPMGTLYVEILVERSIFSLVPLETLRAHNS